MKGMGAMLKPLRWRVAVGVGIGLVRIAASLAFVWICKRLVDIATGTLDAPLGGSIGLMAGILVIQILGNVGASWWESYITVGELHHGGGAERLPPERFRPRAAQHLERARSLPQR